ncbi:M3 family metallopeptidase [Bacteroidales bacterium OttesenSCG-928-C19]|nr:M3 family metallopeptidase [Bacteroidales bacterium OttesenSCG-928-C19]
MKMSRLFLLTMLFSITSLMAQTTKRDNPLLQLWRTPHKTPPFEQIKISDYEPAIEYAMELTRDNVDKITNSKETPTFKNTIEAYENSSRLLGDIVSILFDLNECNTSPELQKVVMDISPKMTRFQSELMTKKLFERVKHVYDQKDKLNLNAEEKMLLDKTYKAMRRSEAGLSDEDAKKYTAIKEELSLLSLKFKQNVLADNNNWYMHVTNEDDLKGLPQTSIETAVEDAKKRELSGWVFTLDMPSYLPFMQYSQNRSLREKMWTAYNTRGNRGTENDNGDIIKRTVELRLEIAKLFGYETYADFILSERMAESKTNVQNLIDELKEHAMPAAKKDVEQVTAYAKQNGATITPLMPWDWTYYSTKLKEEKYSLDQEALRPYFELENVKKGVFLLFEKLYGLKFVKNPKIQVYHEDVVPYEIYDGKNCIGIFYLDIHPRQSKRGGAWMVPFRSQYKDNGKNIIPLIQVVCNFTKPTEQTPALLTFDEFRTFLHEFGHAIHGLLSDVTYETLSGTSVYRDFVELPSQIMENWSTEKEFLDLFAVHYKTGEKIPQKFIDNIIASQTYNEGYITIRQLSLGTLDLAWHSITAPVKDDVVDFENNATKDLLLIPVVPKANTSTAFSHIFAGGYAVGYYGYKWAEVLDADAFEEFKKNGIFDKKTAQKFRSEILSKGGTEHPMQLYINFKGSKPNVKPLLRRAGFIE